MKRSIISALYKGNPAPVHADFEKNVDYGDTYKTVEKVVDDLKAKLDNADCDRLDEIETQYSAIMSLEEDKAFRHGFCLAALLMVEIFTTNHVISKEKNQE